MELDTLKTIYFCKDSDNAEVRLLLPPAISQLLEEKGIDFVELNLSDPDPESTDAAEYRLLAPNMREFQFDV